MSDAIEKNAPVFEKSIAELRRMLDNGESTSVELVEGYLRRIGHYDRHGLLLNSVVYVNPRVFEEAQLSDERRARGASRGPLEGIPFTLKDMYSVAGCPVAAGSPAFRELIAKEDSWCASALRESGAIFLGLTNMPPMADGGMQRGLHGRAESPYNANFLTAAYQSGSSNGCGTSTACSFAAFGLGTETWSSGRTPASNNALAAYTPSKGLISGRGVWPLVPTMDVPVPMARSVEDLWEVSQILTAQDKRFEGDFWREQKYAQVPVYEPLTPGEIVDLAALRLGTPGVFLGRTLTERYPLNIRSTVVELFEAFLTALQSDEISVQVTDFPALERYPVPGAAEFVDRGLVSKRFLNDERKGLMVYAWNRFLEINDSPELNNLGDVDEKLLFPQPPGSVLFSDQTETVIEDYVLWARDHVPTLSEINDLQSGIHALEMTRKVDFEDWLDSQGLDAILFPTVSNIGPFDADFNIESNKIAMSNGVWVGNGNLVFRHLGIPTVTVPLGMLTDIGMPLGVTIAGRAGDDGRLFAIASALERRIQSYGGDYGRHAPSRLLNGDLPQLAGVDVPQVGSEGKLEISSFSLTLGAADDRGEMRVELNGKISTSREACLTLTVNGMEVMPVVDDEGNFYSVSSVSAREQYRFHSFWEGPYGLLAIAVLKDIDGCCTGAWVKSSAVG